MSRLTAWLASRRQLCRREGAHTTNHASARPLSFERYEQRIALSTNAAIDAIPGDTFVIDAREGGWISVGNAHDSALASTTATRSLIGFDYANFGDFNVTNDRSPIVLGSSRSTAELKASGVVQFMADVFVSDSGIVPIPPPSTGQGGDEGGQISMTPFMGPATLGLPSGGDMLYAGKGRPSLRPERFDADADHPNPTPAETLRGRAVVYEVAHVEQRVNGERDRLANFDATLAEPEHGADQVESQALSRAPRHHDSATGDSHDDRSMAAASAMDEANRDRAIRRMDAEAIQVVETAARATQTGDAREMSSETPADAALARTAAHDAAFDQWQTSAEPALEGRERIAAAADHQQRRLLGAALVVLGVLPATKVLRRHGKQESIEDRPPQRRSARSRRV